MPSIDPNYLFQMQQQMEEEEEERKNSTAVEPVPQQQAEPVVQPQERTPRQAAEQSEKSEREEGFWTEAGNWISENLDPLNIADKNVERLTGLAEGTPFEEQAQALDELFPNRKEIQQRAAPVPVVGQAVAFGAGVDAFAMTPITLGARLSNQKVPDAAAPPAEMSETWGSETAFEIGRLLAPTLIGLPPGSGVKVLAAESALETLNQRSADDIVLGRETAIKLGEAANLLGYDGDQLTQDLIEGEKPNAQVINAIIGFTTNFGINISFDAALSKLMKQLGKNAPGEVAEEVATLTGKDPNAVQLSLDDIDVPKKGDPDLDINEASTIDTGVARPKAGETVNEEAIIAHTIRRQAPNLTDVEVRGFTNYKVFSKKHGIRKSLQEATKFLGKVEANDTAKAKMVEDAANWVRQFVDDTNASIDLDRAMVEFPFSAMVEPLNEAARAFPKKGKAFLTEDAITTNAGAAAVTVIGEELGQRLNIAARNAINLENGGKDFSRAVEQYLDLDDLKEGFMLPLRRFKQRWNLGGVAQQRGFKENIQESVGIKGAKKGRRNVSETAPSEEFRKVYKDAEDAGKTPRELWEAYKAGDATAGQTLKTYLDLVAYAPPNTALAHIDNLEGALLRQLRKGNKNASTQLLFASFLTRLAPQVASISSNILNLVKEPIGLFLSGERGYALGQVYGGLASFSDALRVGKRVFQSGMPINTGTKLDASVFNTKLKDQQLDELWKGVQKELNKTGAGKRERTIAWASYMRQKIANHPLNSLAARGLTAGDETSKVIYGAMTANGRAFQEAAKLGIKPGSPEFKPLVNKHFKDVFMDGVKNGELNPSSGVADAASALTFSQNIPKKGNVVDGAFRYLQDAAGENEFWRLVSAFTRVSYWTMEKGGVMLAGSIPGVGGKALMKLVPRYKRIMDGEMGELARLQLKSNFHFAGYSAFMVGGLAGAGFMTGNRPPEGMPKTSFIIPTNNKDGYIAIPYGRLEPVATPYAVIADLVQNFRDNVITEQDYNKAIEEVVISLGLSTLDKSFMTGMGQAADLLDTNNFSEGSVVSGIGVISPLITSRVLPIGAPAALMRMVSEWSNPYDTYSKGDPNFIRNIWASIAERNFGGATNPVKFDPLTGEAIQTTAQIGKDAWWKGIVASLANEALVPGRVKKGDLLSIELHNGKSSSIYKELDRSGFEVKRLYNFRTFEGVGLSLEEQSMLAKDTHDVGKLPQELERYFGSKTYETQWNDIKRLRQMGTADSLRAAEKELEGIRREITHRFNKAKDKAGRYGRLKDQPLYQEKHRDLLFGVSSSGQEMSSTTNEAIQDILSLPA